MVFHVEKEGNPKQARTPGDVEGFARLSLEFAVLASRLSESSKLLCLIIGGRGLGFQVSVCRAFFVSHPHAKCLQPCGDPTGYHPSCEVDDGPMAHHSALWLLGGGSRSPGHQKFSIQPGF